jgi:sugar O-acyltransferase (sialic acid O-acetyltransferase NeuD family)
LNDIKPVIILGSGGHAKVVLDTLLLENIEILGCITPDMKAGEKFCNQITVLGSDEKIAKYKPGDVILVNGIGAMPYKNLRWKIAKQLRDKGYKFKKVIHPSAVIARDIVFEEGVQVMAGVVIQPGTVIGTDSIINTGVLLDHDCKIAKNCHLAPGVICSGGVNIDMGTHIGTGTTVIQNICIGKDSVIASGSSIYKDVADNVKLIQSRQLKQIQR